MAVLPILSIAAYSAAVVGHHPNIDAPEPVEKYHGFLRIGAVVLLLFGFVAAIASFSPEALGVAFVAVIIVGMLAVYDYMIVAKKARQKAKESAARAGKSAKENVAKAGKEYLEAKKEMEKGPDQVTNVHGDAVAQKTKQTHVDQSTTNVDTIDQSTTRVDQSKTVKDQRTHVEDSVVNRADIGAGDEAERRNTAETSPSVNRQPESEPTGQTDRQPANQQHTGSHPPGEQQHPNAAHSAGQGTPNNRQPSQRQNPNSGQKGQASGTKDVATGGGNETNLRYCPSCGEEITPGWSNCISCGADLE